MPTGPCEISWQDRDGDGAMSFDEFVGMLEGMPVTQWQHVKFAAGILARTMGASKMRGMLPPSHSGLRWNGEPFCNLRPAF